MVANNDIENLSFEDAFQELERIVNSLEDEDHNLENSLLLYERGQILAKRCADLLEQAELKVKQISGYDVNNSLEDT